VFAIDEGERSNGLGIHLTHPPGIAQRDERAGARVGDVEERRVAAGHVEEQLEVQVRREHGGEAHAISGTREPVGLRALDGSQRLALQ